MFDHVGFIVKDFSRSLDFYERCLDPDGNNIEAALRE
jgi:hypothetical protein